MPRARRSLAETLALIAGGLAVAWLVLNAGLAQVAKADEVVEVPGELVLTLEEGEQRAVYLRSGTGSATGFTLDGTAFRCALVAVVGDDRTQVVSEPIDETRPVDGWNPHEGFLLFTAPSDGTYELSCRDAASSVVLPADFTSQLTTGVELYVAPPVPGWLAWVSPPTALMWCMFVVFPAGVLYVAAGAVRRRD